MKKIAFILIIILSCLLLFSCNKGATYERKDDTAFVVLQISDIHLANNSTYPKRVFRTLDDLVEISKPDYIVFTGDITNEKDNFRALKTLCDYMESLNIPWTYTFGNHDHEGTATKPMLSEYLAGLKNCIYERGPSEVFGEGNHYVTLRGDDEKAIMTMFMMDSTGETGGTHKFEQSQIDWYADSVKAIALTENGSESSVVPSIAFFHVPTRDFKGAYEEAVKNGTVLYGSRGEEECPPSEDDEMFETMVALGSTKAIFVGHEHYNNYVINYKGIRLTYTNTLDHKLYIPTRGGTIINIKKDGGFTQQGIYRKRDSSKYKLSEEF